LASSKLRVHETLQTALFELTVSPTPLRLIENLNWK